jgi:GNAT superfamily N-acetyltransferase
MIDTKIHIEKVSLLEVQTLKAFAEQTFLDTYASQNTEEDMVKYLADHFNLKLLTEEINSSDAEYYLAKIDKEVVGYFKLNYRKAQTEVVDENALEIERIYASTQYHGKGVGKVLFENILQIAKSKAVSFIWLGVWEKNPRAIRFYEKCGFVEFDKHVFVLGTDEQTDLMMKLEWKNKS